MVFLMAFSYKNNTYHVINVISNLAVPHIIQLKTDICSKS